MPFYQAAKKATEEMIETLDYEVKLNNEAHEQIKIRCDLWGSNNQARVELEVPAYRDDKNAVKQPRMYVTMTIEEFDEVVQHVERFRKLKEIANG